MRIGMLSAGTGAFIKKAWPIGQGLIMAPLEVKAWHAEIETFFPVQIHLEIKTFVERKPVELFQVKTDYICGPDEISNPEQQFVNLTKQCISHNMIPNCSIQDRSYAVRDLRPCEARNDLTLNPGVLAYKCQTSEWFDKRSQNKRQIYAGRDTPRSGKGGDLQPSCPAPWQGRAPRCVESLTPMIDACRKGDLHGQSGRAGVQKHPAVLH